MSNTKRSTKCIELCSAMIVGLITAETSLAGRHDVDESNNPKADQAFTDEVLINETIEQGMFSIGMEQFVFPASECANRTASRGLSECPSGCTVSLVYAASNAMD